MTFEEWWNTAGVYPFSYDPECSVAMGAWDGAIEAAVKFMLSRNVSASEFYATELRKLKSGN